MVSWPRVRFTLAISAFFGLILCIGSPSPVRVVVARALIVGIAAMLVFGLFEQWPKRLPRRVARSVLQLIAIVAVIPFAAGFAYTTIGERAPRDEAMRGYVALTVMGLLLAPWIAVGAMLKQRDAFAREQQLAFDLERSELERKALDTRLRLLQAQVEPHFLFNTLANVQALVDAGSPQASKVLASLIAYLRAAIPRIHDATTTIGREVELVRAYLELMHMRMPDRLQYAIHLDPAASALACPTMMLLTLVENAIRHGIDPSEEGGRIDVDVWIRDGRCRVRVLDNGVGFKKLGGGLGTGLSTLRERLKLAFGNDAKLELTAVEPHGACAEVELPVRGAPA